MNNSYAKEIINEGIFVKHFENCIICNNLGKAYYQEMRDLLFGAPGKWKIYGCSKCELMWINPMPNEDEIIKLYPTYYTHNSSSKKSLLNLRDYIKKTILHNHFDYYVEKEYGKRKNLIIDNLIIRIGPLVELISGTVMWLNNKHKGRLLDVGCGNGKFLFNMKRLGWEAIGVEPDEEAVAIAKNYYKLQVIKGSLDTVDLPENSFDAITMNHVIEHVPNPIKQLNHCYRLLRKGGKLILLTPNNQSLGRKIFKAYWRGWEVPRHLFIFSPSSLRSIINQTNLKIINLRTISKASRHIWFQSRKLGKNRTANLLEKKMTRVESYIFWLIEYALSKKFDIGEEILLIAEKN